MNTLLFENTLMLVYLFLDRNKGLFVREDELVALVESMKPLGGKSDPSQLDHIKDRIEEIQGGIESIFNNDVDVMTGEKGLNSIMVLSSLGFLANRELSTAALISLANFTNARNTSGRVSFIPKDEAKAILSQE